ncbi:MAG: helix-turn-helix domain-containing protein [Polyangiaceae bacterium]|nr:helix-turn-helix domain-containing protein [Polyangiaceae bacterium]
MTRHTTFSFTLQPTCEQEELLRRHVGAARFGFNQCLRFVINALLGERTFHCSNCGHEADRDENAAVCLAQYPRVLGQGDSPPVAAKHAETQNACGEGRSGEPPLLVVRETTLVEAGRAYAQRPRRAVLAKTVNTL